MYTQAYFCKAKFFKPSLKESNLDLLSKNNNIIKNNLEDSKDPYYKKIEISS